VYDFLGSDLREHTLTEDRYGTGSGDATLQIRGSNTVFSQDDESPDWENYTEPIKRSWRYAQIRELKQI
jgi:hypothetical protein